MKGLCDCNLGVKNGWSVPPVNDDEDDADEDGSEQGDVPPPDALCRCPGDAVKADASKEKGGTVE